MAKTQTSPSTNLAFAALVGATASVITIVILTIWAALDRSVWEWLRDNLSHHWVGKGYIAIGVFILSGALVAGGPSKSDDQILKAGRTLYWTTIVSILTLVTFFFYEAFVA